MENYSRNILMVALSAMVLMVSVFWIKKNRQADRALPYYSLNGSTNAIVESVEPGNIVGEFSFVDQENHRVTRKVLNNKVFVVDFFFARCQGICKTMSSQLKRVYDQYQSENNFMILSCTSKPEEDSVEALMAYAQLYGVENHNCWKFMTGEKKELYRVARKEYLIVNDAGDGGEDDFIHTEQMVLCDKQGYIRGYYDGTDSADVSRMILDIKVLLSE